MLLASLMLVTLGDARALEIVLNGVSKDKAIIQVNGRHRVLVMGERNRDGLLLVAIHDKAVEIEHGGEVKRYAVGRVIASRKSKPRPRRTQVRIKQTPSGMYETDGRINDLPVRMMVDTGATLVAMNAREAQRLGIDFRRGGVPGQVSTANGIATAYFVTLKSVRVGGLEVRDVAASVTDGDFPEIILLGMSFINQVNMQNQGRELVFRPR